MIGLVMMLAAADVTGFYTGNKLYAECNSGRGTADSWTCLGYIEGVSDYIDLMQSRLQRKFVCTGPQVTSGQLRDVALKYLGAHPEIRDKSAASLVSTALQEAFPC